MKLSFILPCYNVDRYISNCLDSIFAIGMSEDEYEVICVNDCSTDNTKEIIECYLQRHSNIILIDHLYNKTAGGSRNSGIEVARGEFIWFVDPDDMIIPHHVNDLIETMHQNRLDIFLFNFADVDVQGRLIEDDRTIPESDVMSGQEFVTRYFGGELTKLGIVWRCLFRALYVKENHLFYPMIRKSQDVVFIWKSLLKAARVKSSSEIYYHFRVNPYSVTHNTRYANVLFSERVLFGKEVVSLLEKGNSLIHVDIQQFLKNTITWCANTNLDAIRLLPAPEREKYYDLILSNHEAIAALHPYMNWKNRIVFKSRLGRKEWMFRYNILNTICKSK